MLPLFDASIFLLIALELVPLLCISFTSVKLAVKLCECYFGPLVRCSDACWCYFGRIKIEIIIIKIMLFFEFLGVPLYKYDYTILQRWSRGHKARGQGHKKSEATPRSAFPRTDPLEAKDRNAGGQGQGPRTQAQVFSKKSSKSFFKRISNL